MVISGGREDIRRRGMVDEGSKFLIRLRDVKVMMNEMKMKSDQIGRAHV